MRRLLSCLVLSIAPLVASAAVVVHDIPDLVAPSNVGTTSVGLWFNMVSGQAYTITDPLTELPALADGQFQFLRDTTFTTNPVYLLAQGTFPANAALNDGTGNIARLSAGQTVGAPFTANSFTDIAGAFGNFRNTPSEGFVGVRFLNGGNTHYGFLDIAVADGNFLTLRGFAFESTPDTAITTFAVVPEPGALPLVGLVFVGALLWLRRRARA